MSYNRETALKNIDNTIRKHIAKYPQNVFTISPAPSIFVVNGDYCRIQYDIQYQTIVFCIIIEFENNQLKETIRLNCEISTQQLLEIGAYCHAFRNYPKSEVKEILKTLILFADKTM